MGKGKKVFVIIAIIVAIIMVNNWRAENAKIEKAEQVVPLCEVAERYKATNASFDEDDWGRYFYCTQGDFTVSYDGSFRASDGTTHIWVADGSRSEEDEHATVFYDIDPLVNEWVKDTDGHLIPKKLYDKLVSIMKDNSSTMEWRKSLEKISRPEAPQYMEHPEDFASTHAG